MLQLSRGSKLLAVMVVLAHCQYVVCSCPTIVIILLFGVFCNRQSHSALAIPHRHRGGICRKICLIPCREVVERLLKALIQPPCRTGKAIVTLIGALGDTEEGEDLTLDVRLGFKHSFKRILMVEDILCVVYGQFLGGGPRYACKVIKRVKKFFQYP